MLKYNTMTFGTDAFAFDKKALLVSKEALDASGATSVEGFTITGAEPANTSRRIIFKVDDTLYKFSGGTLTAFNGSATVDNVLESGNTVAELTAITDIPGFVGKKIYPIIALAAPYDVATMPSIKLALKTRANTSAYENTYISPEYSLASEGGKIPTIADIVETVSTTGNGSAEIYCRLQNSEWGDWIELSDAGNQEATAVQFKIIYRVTTLDGSDSVRVDKITVRHNLGAAVVSSDFADLYSSVLNYETDLQVCQVIVKHKKLTDSKIHLFANFMEPTKHREYIQLGIANGERQDMILGVDGVKDTNIDQNTLELYANGKAMTDFDYNVEVSEVVVNTYAGAVITACYDYNHGVEDWIEMEQQGDSQPYTDDGTYMSRFQLTLSDEDAENKKLSNIRMRLERPSGTVTNETLGIANGYQQLFVLPHDARQETISLNADFQYDPASRILTVVAPKNTELVISYDYVGEGISVYGFTVGWAAKV